ncbi:MAG: preprotein translocase subunit SecG [Rickettsiales bacterium]|nr:preprotein translocase subunit SecG [Rickettsiales bacterium]
MEAIFLVIHVFIAVALIGVVLIQRSETDGFGLGSGSGANILSGRQSANLLTRATAILATLFILNSLFLGVLSANKSQISLADRIEAVSETDSVTPAKMPVEEEPVVAPADGENATPQVPVAE